MPDFKYSPEGQSMTKSEEELRLVAYQDIGGVWTIGWGHTGPDVYEGLVWTREQAEKAFQEDVGNA